MSDQIGQRQHTRSGVASRRMKVKLALVAPAIVALIVGGGVGSAIALGAHSDPDPKASAPYQSLSSELDQAVQAQNSLTSQVSHDADVIGNLPSLMARASAAISTASALEAKAHDDAASAGAALAQVQGNDLSGDGVYQAGTDIKAGRYHTQGQSGCYWQVSSDANGNNIVANGNVDGPAFLEVAPGQYLKLQGCADWVLQ